MLNAILSIAGSSHQGHERFSEISRGKQCSFMSFSALLCAQSFPVRHWDTATVDQILIGERMFLNALESQSIPDTDTLSLTLSRCLPAKSSSLDSSIARWLRAQNKMNRPLRYKNRLLRQTIQDNRPLRQTLLCLHSFLPLLSLAFFVFHIEALLSLNVQQNVQE